MSRRPSITVHKVSANRHRPHRFERIAEIGFSGAGLGRGALVSARVDSEGRQIVDVYAVDPGITVHADDTREHRAIDAIATVLSDPTSGAGAKLSAILAAVVHTGRQVTPAGSEVPADPPRRTNTVRGPARPR